MKTVEKLLNQAHKQTVFSNPEYRKEIDRLKNETILKQFNLTIKDDLDFYRFQIIHEGLKNKQAFEATYDRVRSQNFDLWEYLSFKERKKLVLLSIEPLKESMKSFIFADQIIYIPFFNVLMNTLYDKEMPVFELPQFLKMYKSFASEIVSIDLYGKLPYLAGLCACQCLYHDDEGMILWHEQLMVFYYLHKDGSSIRIPLDVKLTDLNRFNIPMMIDFLRRNDAYGIVNYLSNCDFISPPLKKRLNKYLKRKDHV